MRDVVGAGLLEDAVVGDGEADDAAEVRFRHAAFAGEVGDGDGAVEGDVRGDVVFVDCLEAYAVQLRFTALSSVKGLTALRCLGCLRPVEGTWRAREEAGGVRD